MIERFLPDYNHTSNFLIYHILTTCVSAQYATSIAKSIGKYCHGNGTISNALANGVNGSAIPMTMINVVSAVTGAVAQL